MIENGISTFSFLFFFFWPYSPSFPPPPTVSSIIGRQHFPMNLGFAAKPHSKRCQEKVQQPSYILFYFFASSSLLAHLPSCRISMTSNRNMPLSFPVFPFPPFSFFHLFLSHSLSLLWRRGKGPAPQDLPCDLPCCRTYLGSNKNVGPGSQE